MRMPSTPPSIASVPTAISFGFPIDVLRGDDDFWALALFVKTDYDVARVPMLTVTHGRDATRRQIFAYTLALAVVHPQAGNRGHGDLAVHQVETFDTTQFAAQVATQ